MKTLLRLAILIFLVAAAAGCRSGSNKNIAAARIRPLKDTIGFAQYSWQIDSIMARIDREGWKKPGGSPWKFAVSPHDDYTYVGALYPGLLSNIKANNLIFIGVAHPARKMGIENNLVFDSYDFWKGPWGNIRVSPVRNEIYEILKDKYAIINDSLHKAEHSVESMLPFLQYFNRKISIIPILVPAMSPSRMEECGKALADAINSVAEGHGWKWGKDFAIIATTDAVHYGNEDWGGYNYAFMGCDDEGNIKALKKEHEIVKSCFEGVISTDKIKLFSRYTLDSADYHNYIWTWCGRYSVPVAMYTSYYLSQGNQLKGEIVGYSTSITQRHIEVDDLKMGRTAIATPCHWVGYASIGFR